METSSARPYFAIFAIVAIAVAGFILKNEYAGANTTDQQIAEKSPKQMLVDTPNGMVPESIDAWFKRVGSWQDLGFTSEDDMKQTQQMLDHRRELSNITPDQAALIRRLVAAENQTKGMGFTLLAAVRGTQSRQIFVPDVRALYSDDGTNQTFRQITSSWVSSGDKALVQGMADKDTNPKFKQFIKDEIWNIENPGKGV